MSLKHWNWKRTRAVLAVSLCVSSLTLAGKGGKKPPKDDPPPPSTPVLYALHRFALPADYLGGTWTVEEVNDVEELVGYYDDIFVVGGEQPFYLDAKTGNTVATNLNDVQFSQNLNNTGDVISVTKGGRPVLYHPAHGSMLSGRRGCCRKQSGASDLG